MDDDRPGFAFGAVEPQEQAMTLPDPATFIGSRCIIKLKGGPVIIRKVLSIDTTGVRIEEEGGETQVYAFSEIAHVALAKQPHGD